MLVKIAAQAGADSHYLLPIDVPMSGYFTNFHLQVVKSELTASDPLYVQISTKNASSYGEIASDEVRIRPKFEKNTILFKIQKANMATIPLNNNPLFVGFSRKKINAYKDQQLVLKVFGTDLSSTTVYVLIQCEFIPFKNSIADYETYMVHTGVNEDLSMDDVISVPITLKNAVATVDVSCILGNATNLVGHVDVYKVISPDMRDPDWQEPTNIFGDTKDSMFQDWTDQEERWSYKIGTIPFAVDGSQSQIASQMSFPIGFLRKGTYLGLHVQFEDTSGTATTNKLLMQMKLRGNVAFQEKPNIKWFRIKGDEVVKVSSI